MNDQVKAKYLLRMSSEILDMCKRLKLYHGGDKRVMTIRNQLMKADANLYNYSLSLMNGLNRAAKNA